MQQVLQFPMDEFGGLWLVGEPDEGEVQGGGGGGGIGGGRGSNGNGGGGIGGGRGNGVAGVCCREDVAVQAPRLSDLAFGSIAVHGMFEMTLGHGDE